MRGEPSNFNLPGIEDFRKHGKFYKINMKKHFNHLPPELYRFVYPDYADHMFHTKKGPTKQTIKKIHDYCLSLKKEVAKEERLLKKKLLHDYEMKQMEEKIKEYFVNYYENKYKHCKCTVQK